MTVIWAQLVHFPRLGTKRFQWLYCWKWQLEIPEFKSKWCSLLVGWCFGFLMERKYIHTFKNITSFVPSTSLQFQIESPLGSPRSPVVKTWHWHCTGHRFDHWLGNYRSCASLCGQRNKTKKETLLSYNFIYLNLFFSQPTSQSPNTPFNSLISSTLSPLIRFSIFHSRYPVKLLGAQCRLNSSVSWLPPLTHCARYKDSSILLLISRNAFSSFLSVLGKIFTQFLNSDLQNGIVEKPSFYPNLLYSISSFP